MELSTSNCTQDTTSKKIIEMFIFEKEQQKKNERS